MDELRRYGTEGHHSRRVRNMPSIFNYAAMIKISEGPPIVNHKTEKEKKKTEETKNKAEIK